eukprot:Sspe_Gene.69832::Locus_41208_Transcript_1_1_Confidence_1.000_Length_3160::g.69832::m.69832/K00863/DAK, TKFC; triose/dihydroxyacetone kinase / FAD-AMP lyase (cyclizing)
MPEVKRFLNTTVSGKVVEDAIEGLQWANPDVTRLDGFDKAVRVVVRKGAKESGKVAVISGGGSGHEPSHAGLVGEGLLSAAVCGELFASPTISAVLNTILAVTGPAGALLVVKNYTGDRLNFGVACERAKADYGLKVEMVVVADDVALSTNARGICGTVLVHKVAGALAAEGRSLEEVVKGAKEALRVRTMGVALQTCTLPGRQPANLIPEGEMELGLGIHGEPGALKGAVEPCKAVVSRLLDKVLTPGPCAVVINNLGSTSYLEMVTVVGEVLKQCTERGSPPLRWLSGSLMTSLDMHGFSISALPLENDTLIPLLDAPTTAPGWVPFNRSCEAPSAPLPLQAKSTVCEEGSAPTDVEKKAVRAACEAVIANEEALNGLDKVVGDGDCGSTMRAGCEQILRDLDGYRGDIVAGMCRSVESSMGGSSGALYLLGLQAAAGARKQGKSPAEAFVTGVEAITRYGGAKEGDCTMQDALLPAAAVLKSGGAFADAVAAAQKGVECTKAIEKTGYGRSAYVPPEALHGTPDPGAFAALKWLEGVQKTLE